MERRFPSMWSNVIAIALGVIIFGFNHLSEEINTQNINTTLFGGYLFVSIFHGFLFGSKRMDTMNIIIVWLAPIMMVVIIIYSLIYGLISSIPLTIYSIYEWYKKKFQVHNLMSREG